MSSEVVGSNVTRGSTLLGPVALDDAAGYPRHKSFVTFDHVCVPSEPEKKPLEPGPLAHP